MSSPSAQQQRKYIDCREIPSENNCSLKISGTEAEVLEAAVQHAVSAHGHENTAELREHLRQSLKDEAA
jgi:predicted small metal-binding protein